MSKQLDLCPSELPFHLAVATSYKLRISEFYENIFASRRILLSREPGSNVQFRFSEQSILLLITPPIKRVQLLIT